MTDSTRSGVGSVSGASKRLWPATISPSSAYIIDREIGRQLQKKAKDMTGAQPQIAKQLLADVQMLRDTGRAWFEVTVGVSGSAVQAPSGTTEVPGTGDRSSSESPVGNRGGLRVAEVAGRLDVSDRWCVQLIDDGVLSAIRGPGRGRPWIIDEVSVAMEQRRRGVTDER